MNLGMLLPLLAQSDRAQRFVNGFREGNAHVSVRHLLVMALVVLVVTSLCYLVQIVSRMRERLRVCSDRRLFMELCRLHRLDGPAIRALEQIIRQERLEHAPTIFLRPELLAARPAPAGPVSPAVSRQLHVLATLRAKLFSAR
jgi:hypothetical protein